MRSLIGGNRRVVLVTGASRGIGRHCAQALAEVGHSVYGASRSMPVGATDHVFGIPMNADDDASVAAAVQAVVDREGRIDVLINSAGFGIAGPLEETAIADAKSQFDTNVFGVARACRAVLPHFRQQRRGLIVNVGSLASVVALPYQAYYSATKAAVASLSDALRLEVARYGIRVVLVEPGDFKTGFTSYRRRVTNVHTDYATSFTNVLNVVERDEQSGPDPDRIGRLLVRIVAARAPRRRYRVGLLSQRAAVAVRTLLPSRIFEWLLAKYYGV